MRFFLSLIAALLLPSVALANITSNTSASAQSGGNTAGPGQTITTGGASASVSTSNVSGQSSSSFYIKTDSNGEVHEESHSSDSNDVSVRVTTTPKETVVETKQGASAPVVRTVPVASVQSEVSADAQTSSSTPEAASTTEETPGLAATIVLSLQNFFAGLFSWFR